MPKVVIEVGEFHSRIADVTVPCFVGDWEGENDR